MERLRYFYTCRMAQTLVLLVIQRIHERVCNCVRVRVCMCVAIGCFPLTAMRPKIGHAHARLSIALVCFNATTKKKIKTTAAQETIKNN